jgi:DNA-binding winged helix-turn-helix (wHTH) protein
MQINFSEYCLDLATRQLLRGRTEIRLSPKGFELLCLLARAHVELVEVSKTSPVES